MWLGRVVRSCGSVWRTPRIMPRVLTHSSASAMPQFRDLSKSRRAVWALAALLALPAAVIALAPGIARAHAIVVAAKPAMNSTIMPGELEIRLDFNTRIDQKRSRPTLQRPA